ncbi:MAG: xanthine phosphoribosyltransferase [Proteocatella sp.]|mgnify:FL=1|jgi:xanthine phosphoribosyltransferase|nr:xanthine phosphoribosyltransferase [Proteocatella sp.]NCB71405.1 xanthine phosphoribosyltransferase [Clostridia bacterium]MBP7907678.1 xanthine phosphoribosyltransferase [Proteocatella sp.]MBP7913043.1 xanthine phosphoribosyltransferase [Proteocatella sp.]MBP8654211.1 xanthine phosphoribosyltransferase [Proteocatella sp.]
MKLLIDRIIKDGEGREGHIIKVDSFINHQMDMKLMDEIGKEFARRFEGLGINKILTIEASGIGIAVITSVHMGYIPVVFAKKSQPNTMTERYYGAEVKSFTKGTVSLAKVTKKYLQPGEKVLIIDDFMAYGEASRGLISLVQQAGGEVVGLGAVVEKAFQGGGQKLRDEGYKVESLAVISKIHDDGTLEFSNYDK